MKIRNGFVSNSSSSSFVIFGKLVGHDDLKRIFGFTDDEIKDVIENGLYEYESTKLKGLDSVHLRDYGDDEYVIGRSLKGNGIKIMEMILDAEMALGGGCILYRGVDQDGNICLDD